jgi:hypothetical protein
LSSGHQGRQHSRQAAEKQRRVASQQSWPRGQLTGVHAAPESWSPPEPAVPLEAAAPPEPAVPLEPEAPPEPDMPLAPELPPDPKLPPLSGPLSWPAVPAAASPPDPGFLGADSSELPQAASENPAIAQSRKKFGMTPPCPARESTS